MLKSFLIFMFICNFHVARAQSQDQVTGLIEKVLEPRGRDKALAIKALVSLEYLDAPMVLASLRLLVSKTSKWSVRDTRSDLFLWIYDRGHKAEFNPQEREELGRHLSTVLSRIANRSDNNGYGFALFWKTRSKTWTPDEYLALIEAIQEFGIEAFGADIGGVAQNMNPDERKALRGALLKWFEYGLRNSEAEALVLSDMASEQETVSAIRRMAEMYQFQKSQTSRMYFPATAFVPVSFSEDVFRNQKQIEAHLERYRNGFPTLQKIELAEQFLALLNRRFHEGDAKTLRVLERARELGPRVDWTDPQLYQEFLNRLRGAGFAVDGKAPIEAALHAEGILKVDFINRRKIECEDELK